MPCCVYNGCYNQRLPCSNLTFFTIPNDLDRRNTWIHNSGNKELESLPLSAKRIICEKHFDEKYLRRQFNRTTLHPSAVPIPWKETTFQTSVQQEIVFFENNESGVENEEVFVINMMEIESEQKGDSRVNLNSESRNKKRRLINKDYGKTEINITEIIEIESVESHMNKRIKTNEIEEEIQPISMESETEETLDSTETEETIEIMYEKSS